MKKGGSKQIIFPGRTVLCIEILCEQRLCVGGEELDPTPGEGGAVHLALPQLPGEPGVKQVGFESAQPGKPEAKTNMYSLYRSAALEN